jgi:hypothetical protein
MSLVLVGAVIAATTVSVAGAPPSIRVSAAASGVQLDGRLDDAEWANALPVPLTQQSPRPGSPSPYETTVRVVADHTRLYFGFTCRDPFPKQIGLHTMQRDGDLSGDDSVAIVLDTFGDQRSGYYFRINTAGARADGLVSTPEDVPLDWDGVWDARVVRTPEGWTAEIAIPVRTLRFDPGRVSWGFNAERFVPRERLRLRWTGTTLDARLADFRRAGLIEVPPFQRGLGLNVNVNTLARRSSDFTKSERAVTGRVGVDVGYDLTSQLTGVATINTDFAETEVDTRQINLTQFPLFFPEKRAFFLEGSNQFNFGLNLGSDFVPFYSRRIGLVEGTIVPLDAGLKLIGRMGRWGIAALDVETGSAHSFARRNLFASRITYDVNDHLRTGAVLTAGDPRRVSGNRLGGLDATWTTSTFRGDKNLAAGAWAVASHDESRSGRKNGWGVAVDYPNDLWDVAASVKTFGDALDPALGFLPRPGTRQYSFSSAWQPRPKGSWIQQFFFEFRPRLVEDLHGRTLTWRVFTAPFNVVTSSGVHLEANYAPEFQRLIKPFEIADRVTIPPGVYRFNRFRVEGQSSPSRPFRAGTTVWFGEFFGGRLTQVSNFVTWTRPSGRLQLEFDAENDLGHLPFGNFVQRLLQTKVIYAFSPNLILSSFAQYDTESRQVGVNNRIRWTIRPEADLFIVWNRGWKHALFDEEARFAPLNDQFVAKLRWIFRR